MNNTFKVGVDHGEGDMTVFACGNCGVAIPMPNCPSCAALRAAKETRTKELEKERDQWRDAHDAAAADAKKWRRDAQEAVGQLNEARGQLCRAIDYIHTSEELHRGDMPMLRRWEPGKLEELVGKQKELYGNVNLHIPCPHEAEATRLREVVVKASCGPRLDSSKCSSCNGTGLGVGYMPCVCAGTGTVEGERDGYKVAALERILRRAGKEESK